MQVGVIYLHTWGNHNPKLHSWHLHFVLFSLILVRHTALNLLPCTSQCLLCLESSFFRVATVNGHEVLFCCWPVTFQHVPLIMPHLHNNCQKQTHDLNCHVRHWGPSFIHHVQVLVIISTCLFHQLLYDCKIEQHENANGQESLLVWSASVCHNPLEPPVNFWTTGTVGQFVLSFHCVKFLSVVSPVSMSVSLSLWAEMLHLLIIVHQSLILISFLDVSEVRFLMVVILLNTLWPNSSTHQTQHLLTDNNLSPCIACPVTCYCSDMEQTHVLSWR